MEILGVWEIVTIIMILLVALLLFNTTFLWVKYRDLRNETDMIIEIIAAITEIEAEKERKKIMKEIKKGKGINKDIHD